jgi:hypothetical protein
MFAITKTLQRKEMSQRGMTSDGSGDIVQAKTDSAEVLAVSLHEKKQPTNEAPSKRGLASASEETRYRVSKAGGDAPHEKRGLGAAPPDVRVAISRLGGLARSRQKQQNQRKQI